MDEKELFLQAQKGDKEAREALFEKNAGLIHHVIKRYTGRGYETEDIYQIGCMGFIKAIRRFNVEFDVKLSTYAVPYILGEIKRFLRDDGPIKVSRSLKELNVKILELQKENLKNKGTELTLRTNIKDIKSSKRRNSNGSRGIKSYRLIRRPYIHRL